MRYQQTLTEFALSAARIVKPFLVAGTCYVAGLEAYELLTGNSIENIRYIKGKDIDCAVVRGDTMWPKHYLLATQPK